MGEDYKMIFKDKTGFENYALLASYIEGTSEHSKRELRQAVESIGQEFYQLFKIELFMLDNFISKLIRKGETTWGKYS